MDYHQFQNIDESGQNNHSWKTLPMNLNTYFLNEVQRQTYKQTKRYTGTYETFSCYYLCQYHWLSLDCIGFKSHIPHPFYALASWLQSIKVTLREYYFTQAYSAQHEQTHFPPGFFHILVDYREFDSYFYLNNIPSLGVQSWQLNVTYLWYAVPSSIKIFFKYVVPCVIYKKCYLLNTWKHTYNSRLHIPFCRESAFNLKLPGTFSLLSTIMLTQKGSVCSFLHLILGGLYTMDQHRILEYQLATGLEKLECNEYHSERGEGDETNWEH